MTSESKCDNPECKGYDFPFNPDDGPEGYGEIQRCDECGKFEHDEAAAIASGLPYIIEDLQPGDRVLSPLSDKTVLLEGFALRERPHCLAFRWTGDEDKLRAFFDKHDRNNATISLNPGAPGGCSVSLSCWHPHGPIWSPSEWIVLVTIGTKRMTLHGGNDEAFFKHWILP